MADGRRICGDRGAGSMQWAQCSLAPGHTGRHRALVGHDPHGQCVHEWHNEDSPELIPHEVDDDVTRDERPVIPREKICFAPSPRHYICTLPRGHTIHHEATHEYGGADRVVDVWPLEDQPAPEPPNPGAAVATLAEHYVSYHHWREEDGIECSCGRSFAYEEYDSYQAAMRAWAAHALEEVLRASRRAVKA